MSSTSFQGCGKKFSRTCDFAPKTAKLLPIPIGTKWGRARFLANRTNVSDRRSVICGKAFDVPCLAGAYRIAPLSPGLHAALPIPGHCQCRKDQMEEEGPPPRHLGNWMLSVGCWTFFPFRMPGKGQSAIDKPPADSALHCRTGTRHRFAARPLKAEGMCRGEPA